MGQVEQFFPTAFETHKQEKYDFSLWIRKESRLQGYSFFIKFTQLLVLPMNIKYFRYIVRVL